MTTLNQQTLKRWRRNPISFINHALCDPETGRPFILLDAERRFLAHAFQLGDDGRLLYPEQIYGTSPIWSKPRDTARPQSTASPRLSTVSRPKRSFATSKLEQAKSFKANWLSKSASGPGPPQQGDPLRHPDRPEEVLRLAGWTAGVQIPNFVLRPESWPRERPYNVFELWRRDTVSSS